MSFAMEKPTSQRLEPGIVLCTHVLCFIDQCLSDPAFKRPNPPVTLAQFLCTPSGYYFSHTKVLPRCLLVMHLTNVPCERVTYMYTSERPSSSSPTAPPLTARPRNRLKTVHVCYASRRTALQRLEVDPAFIVAIGEQRSKTARGEDQCSPWTAGREIWCAKSKEKGWLEPRLALPPFGLSAANPFTSILSLPRLRSGSYVPLVRYLRRVNRAERMQQLTRPLPRKCLLHILFTIHLAQTDPLEDIQPNIRFDLLHLLWKKQRQVSAIRGK